VQDFLDVVIQQPIFVRGRSRALWLLVSRLAVDLGVEVVA
jgi:hypothetical protein